MGPEIVVFAAVIGLVALAGAVRRSLARRGRSPHRQGVITGVEVRMRAHARLSGTGEALIVAPLITAENGQRLRGRFVRAPSLPLAVRRQVFADPHLISEFSPAVALADPAKRPAAWQQARTGGFHMSLSDAVPVRVSELRDGTIDWSTA